VNSKYQIKNIGVGDQHSIAITCTVSFSLAPSPRGVTARAAQDHIIVWGRNEGGMLGIPGCADQEAIPVPSRIVEPSDQKILDVGAGSKYSVVLYGTLSSSSSSSLLSPSSSSSFSEKRRKKKKSSNLAGWLIRGCADGGRVYVWGLVYPHNEDPHPTPEETPLESSDKYAPLSACSHTHTHPHKHIHTLCLSASLRDEISRRYLPRSAKGAHSFSTEVACGLV
jgi:hypothetical protein